MTIGTDGTIDYVETPDGVRYALGATSILQLVTKLIPGLQPRRNALDEFLKEGRVMVVLDTDALFQFLTPKRTRWSAINPSTTSLIEATDRDVVPLRGTYHMDKAAFVNKLAEIEQIIQNLASNPTPEGATALQTSVASIKLLEVGDQSKNNAFYGLGAPKVDTVEDPGAYTPPPAVTHPLGKSASFATFQANLKLAEEIITQVAETDVKIDALVTAGRKFNASKARTDLHLVTANLQDVLRQVDIAEPWVTGDLQKLAKKCEGLHALFANAKL